MAADRDPSTLPLSLMTQCTVGEDRAETRDRVRRVLELQGDGRDADEVLAHPDDTWLVGTVDEVAERLDVFRAAGVERVMLKHLDHEDLDMVRIIGERLTPAIAARR